jgi:hypothetical protein
MPVVPGSHLSPTAVRRADAGGGFSIAGHCPTGRTLDARDDPLLTVNNEDTRPHTAGTTFVGQFLDHNPTFDVGPDRGMPTPRRCQVDERQWRRGRAGWAVGRWLAGSRNRGDFAPGLALLIHQRTVGGCREAMAPWPEVVANGN